MATHTPMMLNEENGEWTITAHISRGNTQWKMFDRHENTLLIFKGPHSYISSTWYEGENVPTWNYQSVHLYGQCVLLSEEELQQATPDREQSFGIRKVWINGKAVLSGDVLQEQTMQTSGRSIYV